MFTQNQRLVYGGLQVFPINHIFHQSWNEMKNEIIFLGEVGLVSLLLYFTCNA